ncbi:MAG: NAD-dependent epimerase/dehydratase family protein [Candidatus Aenigmarchaeota archaeon]|nr:NAD-dependent epimerase/dehydratase family protein [Candidatus Aenigmarchaeota archaeon]
MTRILVTGATGQIGMSLVPELRRKHGNSNVIAIGHRKMPDEAFINAGPFEIADATNKEAMAEIINKYGIDTVYHLVSLLSATGEKNPDLAWNVNMGGLKIMLDLAREHGIKRIFWPSSIAAFGPTTPRDNTPQDTVLEPNTMYGVTKVAGELMCNYYHKKYGVDVRSLRYPGIISNNALPGGGTTDYAVEIFYEALKHQKYKCYLRDDSTLPMMYMSDAIKATVDLMESDPASIKIRTSYNLAAVSFSPKEVAAEIKKHIHAFECTYEPDFRQAIADSWPRSIDDSRARKDWGWKHTYDLKKMTQDMLEKLSARLGLKY